MVPLALAVIITGGVCLVAIVCASAYHCYGFPNHYLGRKKNSSSDIENQLGRRITDIELQVLTIPRSQQFRHNEDQERNRQIPQHVAAVARFEEGPGPSRQRPEQSRQRQGPRGERQGPRGDRSTPRGECPAPGGECPAPGGECPAPRGERVRGTFPKKSREYIEEEHKRILNGVNIQEEDPFKYDALPEQPPFTSRRQEKQPIRNASINEDEFEDIDLNDDEDNQRDSAKEREEMLERMKRSYAAVGLGPESLEDRKERNRDEALAMLEGRIPQVAKSNKLRKEEEEERIERINAARAEALAKLEGRAPQVPADKYSWPWS